MFLRHYFEFTSTKNKEGKKEEMNKEERPTLTQEDGGTRGRSEGLARHAGGLTSPYLAAGSRRALAALRAGHMFRRGKSKIFHLLEAIRGISRNRVLYSSCVLKKR